MGDGELYATLRLPIEVDILTLIEVDTIGSEFGFEHSTVLIHIVKEIAAARSFEGSEMRIVSTTVAKYESAVDTRSVGFLLGGVG
jgi:hypothetical protein